MKSHYSVTALLAGALASTPVVASQSFDNVFEGMKVVKRAGSGQKCGPTGGNAVCNAGLCCGEDGICGTGGEYCAGPACQLAYGPACDGNQVPSGPDTSSMPRPKFGSLPYGADITSCTVPGKVALTFDDGPYIYTAELLDLLKRNNVPATFFVVGNNGGKGQINNPSSGYTSIVQRMIAEGHQVGSHTWSHADLNAVSADIRKKQIIYNEISLASVLGVVPTYFRPPYTSCGSACYADLSALGYRVVNYDVDTKDWENGGVAAKSNYISAIGNSSPKSTGWIVLAHDIQERTVKELVQYMIDQARNAGFQLTTLGECLGDPPVNWYRDPTTGEAKGAGSGSPQRQETSSSSSSSATSTATKTSSTSSSTTPSLTPTPTPVKPGVDFGLVGEGKNSTARNNTTKSTSSSSTVSLTSSTGSASTSSPTNTPTSAAGRATLPTSVIAGGGNAIFGLLVGLLGVGFLVMQ